MLGAPNNYIDNPQMPADIRGSILAVSEQYVLKHKELYKFTVDGPLHSSMGSNKDTSKPKSVLDNCKKN
jgi:hypothetical protein